MYPGIINDLVGKEVKGYAEGYFGDDYSNKIIVLNGHKWVVALDEDGDPLTAYFDSRKHLLDWLDRNQKTERGD